MELNIDPSFRALIPPLAEGELTELEESIKAEGCRDQIVTWKGTIVDGHNRYDICKRHGIEFRTVEHDFADADSAKAWIITNQLARRNVPVFVRYELSKVRKALLAERGRERQAHGQTAPGRTLLSMLDKSVDPHDTRKTLATELGVGTGTLARAEYVEKHAPDDIKEQARRDEVSINEAYKATKRVEAKAEQASRFAELRDKELTPPTGKYDVVVVDPPWPMEKIERDIAPNQHGLDYRVMNEEELSELELPIEDKAHVFLWTTQRFLPMAFRLLSKWGIKYVCTLVWHKPGGFQPFGLPQYNCEFILYGRKGTPEFVDTKGFPTCFEAPRHEHSEKPDLFFETIARVTAGRRLSMFERKERPGFDSWGDEM